jgi:hypothetical protein
VKPQRQAEFDFGVGRQERIGRALRTSPKVCRAIPLSDMDKLMLACMDSLAQQIADELLQLSASHARAHVERRIRAFAASLGDASPEFTRETSRYLADTVDRLRRE